MAQASFSLVGNYPAATNRTLGGILGLTKEGCLWYCGETKGASINLRWVRLFVALP